MKILLAVDSSKASENAAQFVMNVAEPTDEILVLTVVVAPTVEEESFVADNDPNYKANLAAAKTFDEQFQAKGLRSNRFCSAGPTAGEVIVAVAEYRKSELIVLGRRYSEGKIVYGAESSYVLHHAPCSVLVAKSPEDSQSQTKPQRRFDLRFFKD